MPKLAAPLLIAIVISGCAEVILKAESSPAFVAGYNDGCASGSSTVDTTSLTNTYTKNAARYNAEPDYANGWQNGYRECNGSELRSNPNNPMEQVDHFGPGWY